MKNHAYEIPPFVFSPGFLTYFESHAPPRLREVHILRHGNRPQPASATAGAAGSVTIMKGWGNVEVRP